MFTDQNWRSKMQDASAAIDNHFGEPLKIVPSVTRPNYSPVYDWAGAILITGVFSYRSKPVVFDLDNKDRGTVSVDSRDPRASFSRADLPWEPEQFDLIQRCDGSQFQVTSIKPDGVARIVVELVEMGRAG